VDAVYVAVPHPVHHRAGLLALQADKAVLVEKPFTMNAPEAEELIAVAGDRGLFLMEAMWTRFLPQVRHVRCVLDQGGLGDVRLLAIEFGQWFRKDPHHRLFDPLLGGGALLDLGVYAVSFASMVFGPPARVHAVGDFAFTGVDAQTSIVLQYEGGRQAVLAVTIEATLPNRAMISGTEAYLEIERSWYRPSVLSVTSMDGSTERFDYREDGGLRYEAEEVASCMRAGLLESPLMPLHESVEVLRTMDEIRRQIGLSYPGT
jgi:predicted dehydrogenase